MIVGLDFDLGISLLVISILSLIYFIFIKLKYVQYLYFTFFLILIWIQSLTCIGDIILFKYWDSIFSLRAVPYFANIGEMKHNISTLNSIFVFSFLAFITFIYYLLSSYLKSIISDYNENFKWYSHFLGLIIFLTLAFLSLRGWVRDIPRNQSDAFFCQHRTYNLAAINSTWNFFNVISENNKYYNSNPYSKMSLEAENLKMNELFRINQNSTKKLFSKIENPNVILISMEGISAELLKLHNLDKSEMPFLESIIDSSYYFTKAYSTGFRTEQGIVALLSGALSTPFNNQIENVSLLYKIPSILKSFRSRKYRTSFVFGGNIEFANMKAYLTELKFDSIFDIQNFEQAKRTQQLGVPDEFLFQFSSEIVKRSKSPFFIQIMTQSSHEPYDIPKSNPLDSEKKLYLKSANYLDKQLELFINTIKSEPSFSNTIIVITSDHSHRLPYDSDVADSRRFHIPFLIYSPLLNQENKGLKDTLLFAQQNFPATLSFQFGWKEKNYFKYSQNHFSNSPKFCFSTFVNGYLFQQDSTNISYDYIWRPYDTTNLNLVKAHSYPQAIMQHLVNEIRGYSSAKSR